MHYFLAAYLQHLPFLFSFRSPSFLLSAFRINLCFFFCFLAFFLVFCIICTYVTSSDSVYRIIEFGILPFVLCIFVGVPWGVSCTVLLAPSTPTAAQCDHRIRFRVSRFALSPFDTYGMVLPEFIIRYGLFLFLVVPFSCLCLWFFSVCVVIKILLNFSFLMAGLISILPFAVSKLIPLTCFKIF